MPSELYCEPCMRFLSKRPEPYREDEHGVSFLHHPDVESLAVALALPCCICLFAWKDLKILPTSGSVIVQFEMPELLRFAHMDSHSHSEALHLTPWQDMMHHRLPALPSRNTGSTSALGFLLKKYQECREKHLICRLPSSPAAIYPSRLIDVGHLEDNEIRLRDTKSLRDRGLYTCLSHCWGQKQPFKLTKETQATLQGGMIVSALPQTFQDAVFVTRRLGITFLWIDSLCVFQDNKNDWSVEASRMSNVYNGAACTIAATAAKDSDGGLFIERDPSLLQPRCIEASWPLITDSKSHDKPAEPYSSLYSCDFLGFYQDPIDNSPLNSRAWVCQERYLSPRIMHFSGTQLFWECYEDISCETYPEGLPLWAYKYWSHDSTALKRDMVQFKNQQSNVSPDPGEIQVNKTPSKDVLYSGWRRLRLQYTGCAMTKEEDKLVAIQGVAKDFGGAIGDRLVAGLWYNHLLEDLCWYLLGLKVKQHMLKSTIWRAPTWSWASKNALIWYNDRSFLNKDRPNKEKWSKIDSLDVKANDSGELEHASLRLRCNLIHAAVAPNLGDTTAPIFQLTGVLKFLYSSVEITTDTLGASHGLCVIMDDVNWEQKDSFHVEMVVIQRCKHRCSNRDLGLEECERDMPPHDFVEGLLLSPQAGKHDMYERIGYFRADGCHFVEKIVAQHEATESRVITLV